MLLKSSLNFMFSNATASPYASSLVDYLAFHFVSSPLCHRSILLSAKSSSDLPIFYNNITNAFSLPPVTLNIVDPLTKRKRVSRDDSKEECPIQYHRSGVQRHRSILCSVMRLLSPMRHRSILRFAKSSSDLRIFYNNITSSFSLPACNIKHRRSLDETQTRFEG